MRTAPYLDVNLRHHGITYIISFRLINPVDRIAFSTPFLLLLPSYSSRRSTIADRAELPNGIAGSDVPAVPEQLNIKATVPPTIST